MRKRVMPDLLDKAPAFLPHLVPGYGGVRILFLLIIVLYSLFIAYALSLETYAHLLTWD
jgi:hypothetical protein